MSLIVDVHILQTLPPSLINRDDTGAPKSAIFGGVPRQRVSSQAWKRAIRKKFEDELDPMLLGTRTKRVVELIAQKVVELADDGEAWGFERAAEESAKFLKAAGISLKEPKAKKNDENESAEEERERLAAAGYLLFLSAHQVHNAAKAIIEKDGDSFKKKEAGELLDTKHSVDIAMFGRMLADEPAYNVDASVQVAHALGVHESEPEFDYFTAVDDLASAAEESGAGMLGTVQMMSSTLYRFATIDVESLEENLGDRNVALEAVTAFVNAFVESLPTGKQNTFAHNTLPELVYVTVRDDRSISLVNAFETPVREDGTTGRRQLSAQLLAKEATEVQEQYGFVPRSAFVAGLGDMREPFSGIATELKLPELAEKVREVVAAEGDS